MRGEVSLTPLRASKAFAILTMIASIIMAAALLLFSFVYAFELEVVPAKTVFIVVLATSKICEIFLKKL